MWNLDARSWDLLLRAIDVMFLGVFVPAVVAVSRHSKGWKTQLDEIKDKVTELQLIQAVSTAEAKGHYESDIREFSDLRNRIDTNQQEIRVLWGKDYPHPAR